MYNRRTIRGDCSSDSPHGMLPPAGSGGGAARVPVTPAPLDCPTSSPNLHGRAPTRTSRHGWMRMRGASPVGVAAANDSSDLYDLVVETVLMQDTPVAHA